MYMIYTVNMLQMFAKCLGFYILANVWMQNLWKTCGKHLTKWLSDKCLVKVEQTSSDKCLTHVWENI